jgi:hypothetical protein
VQVTNSKVRAGAYTSYTLEAVIEDQRIVAQHTIPDHAYAALSVKDANDLVESQLWKQLMHHIEHQLRKVAYANT